MESFGPIEKDEVHILINALAGVRDMFNGVGSEFGFNFELLSVVDNTNAKWFTVEYEDGGFDFYCDSEGKGVFQKLVEYPFGTTDTGHYKVVMRETGELYIYKMENEVDKWELLFEEVKEYGRR